ncbi:MAG: 7-carboxy-7-deazaguanine synthase QueE, partial [Mucinivorans sp.]
KTTWKADNFPQTAVAEIVGRATSYPAGQIVITGGEPTLYDLVELTTALHEKGLEIFLETSGTNPIRGAMDWICLSPKKQDPPLRDNLTRANELKVIIESEQDIAWAEQCAQKVSRHCLLYLQPEWSRRAALTPVIIDYIKAHPEWRISLQTHKYMNIP